MTPSATTRVDVARVRAEHPIEQVVAAAGVELTPRGHGFMGCCPFHDDNTASMSVGGVPGRFHCFGCDASGDVIDFVQRLHHLSFPEAVNLLERGTTARVAAAPAVTTVKTASRAHDMPELDPETGTAINALAWGYFSRPVAIEFADHYLEHHRGIELEALRSQFPRAPLVGSVGHAWTGLVDHLRALGVGDDEILAMDLGVHTRRGSLVDALRDRIVIPVCDGTGRITGFIGRDTSGNPRAPKYRNPTRTPTFDKSTTLYRPTQHRLDPDGTVVVVEGPLDALAIAAAAARTGHTSRFAPCTANGVTVSAHQAEQVADQRGAEIVIALDADTAGAEGTLRWVAALAMDHHRAAAVTRLPHGLDPADWLARHGDLGLTAFDATTAGHDAPDVAPQQPGRELVQLCLPQAKDPIRDTVEFLLPLAGQLRPPAAAELLHQAEDEMTRSGWNPDGVFSRHLRDKALAMLRHPAGAQQQALSSPPFRDQRPSLSIVR